MRILHFSSAETWRGGEQQIIYLFKALEKYNIQQWIFCRAGGILAAYCLENGIAHYTYQKGFSSNPFVAWKFKKLCSSLHIDIAHIHDSHSHTYAWLSALMGNSVPFVLSRRVDFPISNNFFSYKKYNHPSFKKIIAVSNKIKEVLHPAIEAREKIVVIHSGIAIEKYTTKKNNRLRALYKIKKDYKIIANIAAIAPHKDYFTFVDTAERLLKNRNDIVFFLIGKDAGDKAKIQQYIQLKKIENHFIFTGFRNDIPIILPEIDILLFTSKEEGLGTAIIEALASGVPIVATSAGGIPEIIQQRENGLLAPIGASSELAKQVELILNKEIDIASLQRKGKETAALFSKEIMASKTLKIYRQICRM